uniref:hypothetical protein n=1 Tax=Nonomuraea sp. CA-251285 TaxID=3240002 RepID=UPI003F49A0E9
MHTTLLLAEKAAAADTGLVGLNFFAVLAAGAYLVYYERKKDAHQWPDMVRGGLFVLVLFVCFPALAVAMGAGFNTMLSSIVDGVSNIKFES